MRGKLPWPGLAVVLLCCVCGHARVDDADAVAQDEKSLKEAKIASDGPSLLEFFRKRTISSNDLERIKKLITELGDDSFEVRQNASAGLVAAGSVAVPFLKQVLKDQQAAKEPDLEVVRRAENCLKHIQAESSSEIIATAARMLAVRKPAGTTEVLLAYLPSVEDEMVAESVRETLTSAAVHDGKPDAALVAALADRSAVRRGAAGAALCRAKVGDLKPAIRKLLEDPDPNVRLDIGLALAEAKDKDALPILIALLDVLPANRTGLLEDALYLLAGDKAPGDEFSSRRAYREKWQEWWRANGANVDLAKLTQAPEIQGYTMLVLLDEGIIREIDKNKRLVWEMKDVAFPLDVQHLPDDLVLVAEQGSNRITERDHTGKVVKEWPVLEPLMAQRLPNGSTLVATRQQVYEINSKGQTTVTHFRPGSEYVMRAQKLKNGDLALVLLDLNTNNSRYVRLDAKGKETATFPVQVRTSGGRIDVLHNGHVLVPELPANRVVEYDTAGKVVREWKVMQPIAAARLPNGHTLVTSMTENRAVEFDRSGKQVWEFPHESRVSRAYRR
jgi:hypothetical protein